MQSDSQRGTILLVDDNTDIRMIARLFLETAGYTVIAAADGEEGLRSYEQHRSTIMLLLTDVTMPNIDGLELADRVLGMNSQLPVLFMSGHGHCNYRGLECLAKPFHPTELIETVNRVLYARSHSEGAASAA
jgi:two-component system, cell cycle sensor histidine kinase and response regulator CckA